MQSILGRFAFLSVAVLLASETPLAIAGSSAASGDAAISVAGLTLNVPAPAGTRAISKASGVFKTVEAALPPMLRLEGAFYGVDEASDVEAGRKPPSGPFFQVQINKTFEDKRFSVSDFANVRKSMLKELGDSAKMAAEAEKALGDGSKRIAKSTGVDVKLNPGQSVFLPPHLDEASMLGFSFRMGFQVSGSGNVDVDEEMTGTGIMAHVRGKAVQLYAYFPGSGPEALESSRKTAKEWAAAVIAANPVQSGDESSSFGLDWSRIGDKAMIGAVIGAIAGVLGVLLRKKKSAAPSQAVLPPPVSSTTATLDSAFSILGLTESATLEDIKLAYRKRIRDYHPDRVANLGPELKDLAERKAKEINAAYEFLMSALQSRNRR